MGYGYQGMYESKKVRISLRFGASHFSVLIKCVEGEALDNGAVEMVVQFKDQGAAQKYALEQARALGIAKNITGVPTQAAP